MNKQGYFGQEGLTDDKSDFNAQSFLVWSMLGRVRTVLLAKVVAVTNEDDASVVGFVDVHPLVNMMDGAGNATPHGTVLNLTYFRMQGGSNAVIMDPKVDDIGIVLVCDRDISAVKASKAQAAPGSRRRFSLSDGLYLGGVLNGIPTQYVRFHSEGIELVSPNKVTLTTPVVEVSGALRVKGEVTAAFGTPAAVGLLTHRHGVGTPTAPGTTAPTGGI